MMNLTRSGKITGNTPYGLIDNLTMTYTGNQLIKVVDNATAPPVPDSEDFRDYTDKNGLYTYNANGAMITDSHKGILGIKYNSLNLPQELAVKNINTVGKTYYTYSAGGQKLKVVHKSSSNMNYTPVVGSTSGDANYDIVATTDYVGNMVYENGSLKILFDGGYYEND
ncbi:MAG: RHS repeat-associated core domain-containing protein, partial [Prevotella sp.]|nr:RHS repeat-associated core domain-containing protein [Prevotella sp.]